MRACMGPSDPSMEFLQTHLKPQCLTCYCCLPWFLCSIFGFISCLPISFQHVGFAVQFCTVFTSFDIDPIPFLLLQSMSSDISQWPHAYYHNCPLPGSCTGFLFLVLITVSTITLIKDYWDQTQNCEPSNAPKCITYTEGLG